MIGSQNIYIQLSLEKFNTLTVDKDSSLVDHMAPVAKNLLAVENPILAKMQVSNVLNTLPPLWDSFVISLNCSK